MKRDFEYMNYTNSDRLAMLENRAAELERRLGESGPARGIPDYPAEEFGTTEFPMFDPPSEEMFDPPADEMFDPTPDDRPGYPGAAGYRGSAGYAGASDYGGSNDYGGSAGYGADLFVDSGADRRNRGHVPRPGRRTGGYRPEGDGYPGAGVGGPDEPDDRTEVLINRGRRNAQRGLRRWRAHWKGIMIGLAAVLAGAILLSNLTSGGGSWPASVAQVRNEIAIACQNPNVV